MNRWQWALYMTAYNLGRAIRWLRGNEEFHVVERQTAAVSPVVTLEDELDSLIAQMRR